MAKKKTEKPDEENIEVNDEQAEVAENVENTEAQSDADGKLDELQKEIDGWKDKYMRLAAEYDNYRKRTANEKTAIYGDATAKACTELLPVADSVTLALDNLKNADPEILKGVRLISNQLDKSFEKLGIESYGKQGDKFDPNLHNAVSKIEDENLEADTIAAVYQNGYKLGDKIIRHAMVQVANCS